MAITVLPRRDIGEELGRGLGTGISAGLQQLLSQKLQQMQQQKVAQGLGGLFSPQQAQQLSGLPPQLLQPFIKSKLAEPGEQAYAQALQSLSGQSPLAQNLETVFQSGDHVDKQEAKAAGISEKNAQLINKVTPITNPEAPFGINYFDRLNAQQATKLTELQQKRSSEQAKERRHAEEQERKGYQMNKKEITELINNKRQADEDLASIDRLRDLDKEGKLTHPGVAAFFENLGWDVPAIFGADTQQFKKEIANRVQGVSKIFGGRVSNFELGKFMERLPSLTNSPQGRARIYALLERESQAKKIYFDELSKIRKENNGKIPYDYAIELEERIGSKLEKLSKQVQKQIDKSKEIPETSGFLAGLGTAAGKTLAGLAPAAKGAAGGALAGRFFGPQGALAGGILGGLGGLGGLFGSGNQP